MDIEFNELNVNANGGSELMHRKLLQHVDPVLLDKFQIICSRVREINPDKIPVLWCHDLWNDPEAHHLKDPQSRQRFAQIIFVSAWQQYGYNIGLGVPYNESLVFRNAIDPIDMSAAHKPDPTKQINLIYHTTPHRGLELLVPVFKALVEQLPHINMHLDVFSSFKAYGWEERDKPYEFLFDQCRQHPNITYHGYQPNETVRQYLAGAHIFAYPNIWLETSCIAAIEAMSAGLEIVAPYYGALPETCGNFINGYSFSEDPRRHGQRFANMLGQVITDIYTRGFNVPKLNVQTQYAEVYYGWATRAKEWELLLQALAEQHSKKTKFTYSS